MTATGHWPLGALDCVLLWPRQLLLLFLLLSLLFLPPRVYMRAPTSGQVSTWAHRSSSFLRRIGSSNSITCGSEPRSERRRGGAWLDGAWRGVAERGGARYASLSWPDDPSSIVAPYRKHTDRSWAESSIEIWSAEEFVVPVRITAGHFRAQKFPFA